MLQNPHHYPGVTLSHWCRAARRGADKRLRGIADRNGARARATNSTTTLGTDGVHTV